MSVFSLLPFAAALLSLLVGLASLLPKRPSLATWCFFAGMVLLGLDSLISGLALHATQSPELLGGLTIALVLKAFESAIWLLFSLTYSRREYRESLARWRVPLALIGLLPIALSLGFRGQLLDTVPAGEEMQFGFGAMAKVLNVSLLVALVWILTNLEQTFRAAIGTMRWRVKFVILGLGVIFGARLYVRSQALLFSSYDVRWPSIESSGLLIGCIFLMVAYLRTGLAEIDVYPSRAALRSSVTVLIAGSYLLLVGVLANIAKRFGGSENLQFEAFVVLLGMAGLGILLLSDRLRQRVHTFVGRHFARAQHDSVRIWTESSRRLANVKDQAGLCAASARLVSEIFDVLSVTIWVLDEQKERFILGAATGVTPGDGRSGGPPASASSAVVAGLRTTSAPFTLTRQRSRGRKSCAA